MLHILIGPIRVFLKRRYIIPLISMEYADGPTASETL